MRFKISNISKLPKHIQEQIVITNPRKKSHELQNLYFAMTGEELTITKDFTE